MEFSLVPKSIQERYPLLYAPDQRINRHQCTRKVPMQVLALGFGRTGTLSMRMALEKLGTPCYHFQNLYTSIQDADVWVEAYDAKYFNGSAKLDREFWDGLLGHVGAVADFPSISFAAELIEAYPDAKVILWEREEDTWFRSFEESVIQYYGNPAGRVLSRLDPAWLGRLHVLTLRGTQAVFSATSKEQLGWNARKVYRTHFATIRRLLRDQPDRLIEYNMGNGWEPICKLLN